MLKITAAQKKARRADFRAADYAAVRLPDETMRRLTGASRVTVARWRTGESTPPAAAVRLAALVYTGELDRVFGPAWHGFRLAMDGRLYLPGFRYGFAPGELAQWFRLVCQRDEFAHRIESLKTALQDAQSRADYWRMLATLPNAPAPAFALS